jgi:valyl-tRNA synthetase
MSKSRGNTVDPLDWIDRFGADALRFTLARGANPGGDVAVSEEWAAGSRNFCNKLWNAARFSLMNGAHVPDEPLDPASLTVADRWILSRLASVTAQVDALFEDFEFGKISEALYHFAWDEYCDWYLELAKVTLSAGDQAAADRTRAVLGHVADRLLRLLHPLMPFVTDELWTALTGGESVMVADWPGTLAPGRMGAGPGVAGPGKDQAAEAEIESLMRLVTQVRRFRSDQGLAPGQRVPAALRGIEHTLLAGHETSIRALLRLTPVAGGHLSGQGSGEEFTPTASVQAEGVMVELDTASVIDIAAERRRLEKDLAAAADEVDRTRRKLGNPGFTGKAPAAVVDKTRQRLAAAEAEIEVLQARLAALPQA